MLHVKSAMLIITYQKKDWQTKSGFIDLSIIAIWDWMIFHYGDCRVHCRSTLDASNFSPLQLGQLKMSLDIVKYPLWGKIAYVESHWSRLRKQINNYKNNKKTRNKYTQFIRDTGYRQVECKKMGKVIQRKHTLGGSWCNYNIWKSKH